MTTSRLLLRASQLFVITMFGCFSLAVAQDQKPVNADEKAKEVLEKIKGSENKPAKEVFKNIQVLTEMPAARLLAVMKIGYSGSLGVSCDHCHVVDQWEKDDKAPKLVARDMIRMLKTINTELLPKVKNLKNEKPIVNCTTCHRGQVVPALNLPKPEAK